MRNNKSKTMAVMCGMLSVALVFGPVTQAHAVLNVPITMPVTVEATVSTTNALTIAVKNNSDDTVPSPIKMTFATASGIAKAGQYVQIDYNSNAPGARIVIRTDNRNSTIPFTGDSVAKPAEGAGLVGNTDSKATVPLLWVVFDDVAAVKSFVFTGDTDATAGTGVVLGATPRAVGEAEGFVIDKNNKTAPGTDPAKPGEIGGYEDPRVQGYATVVVPQGTGGLLGSFPADEDGAGSSTGLRICTSPIFLALGSSFNGVTAQKYSTSTLALDLITQ